MTIDLNKAFSDLDGNPMADSHMGQLVAQTLSTSPRTPAIKLWDWALKLWNKQPIEIETSDRELLIQIIEEADKLSVMAKAQIILAIKPDSSRN